MFFIILLYISIPILTSVKTTDDTSSFHTLEIDLLNQFHVKTVSYYAGIMNLYTI